MKAPKLYTFKLTPEHAEAIGGILRGLKISGLWLYLTPAGQAFNAQLEHQRNDRPPLADMKGEPQTAREKAHAARWYLGSMNDGLFIINTPPRPSNDDVWPDRPNGPSIVLNVVALTEAQAQAIVDAHNAGAAAPQPEPSRDDDLCFRCEQRRALHPFAPNCINFVERRPEPSRERTEETCRETVMHTPSPTVEAGRPMRAVVVSETGVAPEAGNLTSGARFGTSSRGSTKNRPRSEDGKFVEVTCDHRTEDGREREAREWLYQRRLFGPPADCGGAYNRQCPRCLAVTAEGVTPPWPETFTRRAEAAW